MPKPLQYKANSFIYCQGEESDRVFILQDGKVNLIYEDIETRKNVQETVQPGDFFGVKSAIGRYPREENAVVVSDAVVLAFTVPEFELYAMSDTKIILNLLRSFSIQMRQIHKQISLLSGTAKIKPDEGLFVIGEKYLKNKRFSHAIYIFTRYLTLYPKGKDAEKAAKNLQLAEIGAKQQAPLEKFNAGMAYYDTVNLVKRNRG
jgi:CRP-like cAMP-binding protein